jgi:hypothetical protein
MLFVIDFKSEDQSRRIKKRQAEIITPDKDKNFFKKGFGKIKMLLQTKDQKQAKEIKEN